MTFPEGIIDPDTEGADGWVTAPQPLADGYVAGDRLSLRSPTIPYSESPYYSRDESSPLDTERFPTVAGLTFNLFTCVDATYRVCDDGDPASCADGLASVVMPVDIGDPCDDPNIDIDCPPYEVSEDTTCADGMSICEVPGCTWSDEEVATCASTPASCPKIRRMLGRATAHRPATASPPTATDRAMTCDVLPARP